MAQTVRLSLVVAVLASFVWHADANADAARGKNLYESRCVGCHSVDDNRVGPAHRGVIGRRAGSVKDYDYSPALKTSKVVWDVALLQRWLTDPEGLIPGQRMGYSVDEAKDRMDIAEYLATLK